jgi:cytochrome P450
VIKKEQSQLYLGLLEETKQRLAQGKGTDCFLSQCLKKQDKEWSDDVYLGYVGGVLLEGGAETSASTTMVFILAMAAYPDVLERAQEEVDRICGVSNMPGTNDINRLPYIRACMMEILRWRPILPNGLPHHTTGKDTYQNYDIPTDTNIIINTWTINHDETFYDNPAAFNPSRYLQNEYGSAAYSANLDAYKGRRVNYTFGAGRRVCPGQRFAENSLMLHFAKLVWAFDMEPIGKLPVDSWDGWTDGIVTRPKDLNVQFKLRDERRNKVIEKAWLEADAFLRQYES